MKKKKSSEADGVSQDCLLKGKDILAIPLTRLIDCSITSGEVPSRNCPKSGPFQMLWKMWRYANISISQSFCVHFDCHNWAF